VATENTLDPLTYYRWKWQKFRADRRVQRMDYICKGIYRELLDECWVKGFVLANVEDLADIIGCEEEVIEKYWHLLSKCLVLLEGGKRLHTLVGSPDEEGGKLKLISPSLNEERTKKDAERIGRAISGAMGGKAKNDKSKEASASKSLAKKEECHIEEKRREEKENKENGAENKVSTTTKKVIETRKNEFGLDLKEFEPKFGRPLLLEFFNYWSEHGKKDKKMRFEKQTSWNLKARIIRWKAKESTNKGNPKPLVNTAIGSKKASEYARNF